MISQIQMLAAQTRREFISVILSSPVCRHLTQQPQGANTILNNTSLRVPVPSSRRRSLSSVAAASSCTH